jgi:predicted AAA+ superfamily ATPase
MTTIFCEGHATDVTTNLGNALRYLRQDDKELIIWVDALCINQQDVNEKTRQVGMMGEIYRRCSRVYIWLGPNDDAASDVDSGMN